MTDKSFGVAEFHGVNNNIDIKIIETKNNYNFVLKKKYLKKYKFVYVGKNVLKNESYIITYSNSLQAFR
jgi:hypothetical protein